MMSLIQVQGVRQIPRTAEAIRLQSPVAIRNAREDVTRVNRLVGAANEALDNEAEDRCRIVRRMIDPPSLCIWRYDNRGDPVTRAPAITLRRCHVIPEAAIFVIGDDDEHVLPLRALLQVRNHIRDVLIAGEDIGIAGVLVQRALRLVEGDGRKLTGIDVGDELYAIDAAVPKVICASLGTGCIIGVEIKGLVMGLELVGSSVDM